jgi:unsaturated chondroitin disaccharide hydrolase
MFCGTSFRYAGFRGYDASGDRTLFGLGLAGADAMRAASHDGARRIPLGTLAVRGPEQFRGPAGDRIGAVDNVYTALPVLRRAYEETGDPGFRDVAVSHADRHLDWYVREDGRTWHRAVFDDEGTLVRQYNELADSDEGLVPYRDFEVHVDATTPRDTSAAVLVGYGLSRLPATDGRTRALGAFGRRALASLVESSLVTDPDDDRYGRLRHGCFNAPGDYATDAEHVRSDYYLAYALTALDADGGEGARDGSRGGETDRGPGRTTERRTGRRRKRVGSGHR